MTRPDRASRCNASLNGALDTPNCWAAAVADYLLRAKDHSHLPYDPVARFHLGNGAVVHAAHANAEVSDKGKAQSGGTMVNYHYDLGKIAQNHEKLATTKEVAATAEVKALAASSPLPLL